MHAHNHAEHVAGCFRCDLSREESPPTTEEVRDAFAIRKWDNFQRNYPNSHDKTERDAERKRFDRWLAQVKAEAWEQALHTFADQVDEVQEMWIKSVTNPYRAEEAA